MDPRKRTFEVLTTRPMTEKMRLQKQEKDVEKTTALVSQATIQQKKSNVKGTEKKTFRCFKCGFDPLNEKEKSRALL